MDIRQLKYFIAVADSRNLSHAAKNLFITQPTLSQSIKKLESELNTSLFNYNDKQFTLTETGEILYHKSKRIVLDFDELIEEIHTIQKTKKQTIRVGLTALFAIQFMEQISLFIATHPNVEIHLIQAGSRKLQNMLANEEIDIGLNSFPQINNDIIMEPLHTTTQGYDVSVVMPKDHPLANRQSIGFKDLKDAAFSAFTTDFMLGQIIIDRGRNFGFEPNIVFVNNDWEVLVHSVENFKSVSLIPTAYQPFSTINNLVWIPLADKNNYYPIGISLRKGFVCTQEMSEFISLIKTN